MKLGVWIPNCRHLATPEIIRPRRCGLSSSATTRLGQRPRGGAARERQNFGETIFDPLVTLGVIAGATSACALAPPC
jgi:hypothetical protein